LQTVRRLDFRGDSVWINSLVDAFAEMFALLHRDFQTELAFVTVLTAASIMGLFFTLPQCSIRML
jgi:hypothetical protein